MLSSLYFPHYPSTILLGQCCLLPLLAVCILACTLFEAWLFTFLQASPSLQARWWEDVDFLQFTENAKAAIMSKQVSGVCVQSDIYAPACTSTCVYLFYVSASTLSVCLNVHQLLFNLYFPPEGWCLANFLENNDASSIFCKSADEKEFSRFAKK